VAGAFIQTRTQAGPGDEIASGGKHRPVVGDFGEDDGGAKGREGLHDAALHVCDRALQHGLRQMQPEHEAMMSVTRPWSTSTSCAGEAFASPHRKRRAGALFAQTTESLPPRSSIR